MRTTFRAKCRRVGNNLHETGRKGLELDQGRALPPATGAHPSGPDLDRRPVVDGAPDLLDCHIADRDAAIRPILEEPYRVGPAEPRGHPVHPDAAARPHASGTSLRTVGHAGIG